MTGVSLLGALITAESLSAVAEETRSGNISRSATAGSGFTSLTIAGLSVSANTRPDLTVAIPSFGNVIINEQVTKPALGSVSVNALEARTTKPNVLGIPVGARLTLGSANAVARQFSEENGNGRRRVDDSIQRRGYLRGVTVGLDRHTD